MKWIDILQYARQGNPPPSRRVERTDEEWRSDLPPDVFQITRKHGTERAFTGAYCEAHQPGLYACICCGEPLFDSRTKFNSGTGWPSFTQPVAVTAIKYIEDNSYGMSRVEVQCNVCDSHLGHVFPDGPAPSGLRFCINSASLKLVDKSDGGV